MFSYESQKYVHKRQDTYDRNFESGARNRFFLAKSLKMRISKQRRTDDNKETETNMNDHCLKREKLLVEENNEQSLVLHKWRNKTRGHT